MKNAIGMKALVLNCSHSEAPMVDELLRRGFIVHSLGSDPTALYSKVVDKHFLIDFSITDQVESFIAGSNYDLYLPACTEKSLAPIAQAGLAQKFKFRSVEHLERYMSKEGVSYFAGLCSALSCAPRFIELGSEITVELLERVCSNWSAPAVMVKPLVSAGGDGVWCYTVGKSKQDSTFVELVDDSRYLIEASVSGVEYSVSFLISDKEVVSSFWDIELSDAACRTINASYWLPNLAPIWLEDLQEDVIKLAKSGELEPGIFHLQVIDDGSSPKLVDITRRCPGDMYALEVQKITGFDFSRAYLDCLLGRKIKSSCNYTNASHWKPFFRAVCVADNAEGAFNPMLTIDSGVKYNSLEIRRCVPDGYVHNGSLRKRLFIMHFTGDESDIISLSDRYKEGDLYKIAWGRESR